MGLYQITGELQTEHLIQEKGKTMMRTAFFHLLIKHQHLKQILKEIIIIQDMEHIGRWIKMLKPFPVVEYTRLTQFIWFWGIGILFWGWFF